VRSRNQPQAKDVLNGSLAAMPGVRYRIKLELPAVFVEGTDVHTLYPLARCRAGCFCGSVHAEPA